MDIIAGILHVLEGGGQSKTAIMRKANLNFKRVNIYINFLLSRNLILVGESFSSKKYFITKKGLEFLKDYRSLRESEEKLIEALRKPQSNLSLEGA
ncbi:MAG: winged helix-turn-helix domain-containing protein [Candidatus Nezhaarchaeales archaeon]